MDLKQIKDLINEVLRSDISEFELEHSSTKLKLKRGVSRDPMIVPPSQSHPVAVSIASPESSVPEAVLSPAGDADTSEEDSALHIVTSPIVGTFYRASSPGAEPYVKLGDQVAEGTILCLVEAMKLMNEIPSDIEGEVVRIYVENGHPVEFGQQLFGIRPRNQG